MAANNTSMESNFVSMKTVVEFLNVQDQYCFNEDLHCTYKFNDYSPQEGDRLAIFKLGWNFVKDYVVFEWVPVESVGEDIHLVVFNKHILPKNNVDIYQICYLSGENELYGASSLFQFSSQKAAVTTTTSDAPPPPTLAHDVKPKPIPRINEDSEVIKDLKEENLMLRTTLKFVVSQKNEQTKNYDEDITELRQITDSLKASLDLQQKEINMLKTKIMEGGEEYKKLYIEKCKIEKKYEQLKSKKDEKSKTDLSDKLATVDLLDFNIDELRSMPPFPCFNSPGTLRLDCVHPNVK
ncbi:unnamed protein product [Phaedon cochleariae]|uniref:SKICH domain-containing protein n=1 Tax=Phaedon cochleariae TaxID=80249 RepID=A0A9N9WX12_PHACE|nr:unnamed protein product [Phaedon cochleariae]